MNARVFTREEAQAVLPGAREIVRELQSLRRKIAVVRERMHLLEALWGADVRDDANPDAAECRRCRRAYRGLVRQFHRKAEQLDGLGCHVKDLDAGIVGFFHVHDGRATFMSWDLNDPTHETYEDLEHNPVVHTLESAHRLLPRLRGMFQEFDQIGASLEQARYELGLLAVMWGDAADDDGQPDAPKVRELTQHVQRLVDHGRDLERELHLAGCVLKDFHRGLVDFYHVRDGQLVFLCWQRNEPNILAWHPLDRGYSARQPSDGTGERHTRTQ